MIGNFLKQPLLRLAGCSSGNATLMMALGMPVLIGGAGLGVDLAQWYMWKRELQFAVDQAAVAGAWARAESETESTYITRATQEFDANLTVTEDIKTTPTVQLADYAGGTANSVAVWATATKKLPFSHFVSGTTASVYAYAQASFEEGVTFTSCLIATDDDDYGAVTIGGSSVLTASCGIAALSTDETAITVNGNPTVDAGWILAAGGVDPWFHENTDDIIIENMEGLYDPFEHLTPPNPAESQVARTYSCKKEADTTTADITTRIIKEYTYWKGESEKKAKGWAEGSGFTNSDTQSTEYGKLVHKNTKAGSSSDTNIYWHYLGGEGSEKKYAREERTDIETISNVVTTTGEQSGNVVPGTYAQIHVGCDTSFSRGVYYIDGGGLIINGQHEVNGAAVMFVLLNGAYIQINGGADVNLTAMQASDLMAVGVSADDANDLAGMLVFEDRDGPGSNKVQVNGNANTILNGKLYFPVSTVNFAGTAGVTSQCLMIAANNINITGTTNMTTFCPPDSGQDDIVATTAAKVRLIA